MLAVYTQRFLGILKKQIIRNKQKLKSVEIPLERYFKETWPLIAEEADFRAKRIHSFVEKTGFLGEELWENLTPKVKPEYRLESKELMLRGIIDELEVHGNSFVPVELKTGSAPKEGVWPGHKIQVGAYAMLLEEKFKTQVKEGFVNYLDAKETRHIAINPFMKEEIINLVKEVQELLKNQNIPNYCENKNKCAKCGLRETCYNETEVNTLLSEI